jgi:hypothetical protein
MCPVSLIVLCVDKIMKLFVTIPKQSSLNKSQNLSTFVSVNRGEDFGKPMNRREGESSNEFMSRIIRHLMKDKGYSQVQAVAAAYKMSGIKKGGVFTSTTTQPTSPAPLPSPSSPSPTGNDPFNTPNSNTDSLNSTGSDGSSSVRA